MLPASVLGLCFIFAIVSTCTDFSDKTFVKKVNKFSDYLVGILFILFIFLTLFKLFG